MVVDGRNRPLTDFVLPQCCPKEINFYSVRIAPDANSHASVGAHERELGVILRDFEAITRLAGCSARQLTRSSLRAGRTPINARVEAGVGEVTRVITHGDGCHGDGRRFSRRFKAYDSA